MKFDFFGNACCQYTSESGARLLCDPWLVDGAFYGAWYHYPKLEVVPNDVNDAEYVYISHLHPDHYDKRTLITFRRDTPIIYLDHGDNFLERILRRDGFTHLIGIKHGQTEQVGPFKITMYAPFVTHPFFQSDVGNLIDSAMVIECDGEVWANTNDNTPSVDWAKKLREIHGTIDVAQLNFNAAGMYPSCFMGSSTLGKLMRSHAVVERNLNHLIEVSEAMAPRVVMPFAGQYVLGGKNWQKNFYLGTVTMDDAGRYLEARGVPVLWDHIPETNTVDMIRYIKSSLSLKLYDYEKDPYNQPTPDDLQKAQGRLLAAFDKYGYQCKKTIRVNYAKVFDYDSDETITFSMDPKLFFGIVSGKYHWNNAEIGCHIEFDRTPDQYDPDLHTLMSFWHV